MDLSDKNRFLARMLRPCRLCGARIDDCDAVELSVPRGVHFFLRVDQLATDCAARMTVVSCRYCGHLQSLDEPVIYDDEASSATYVSAPLVTARQVQAMRTFAHSAHSPQSVLEIGCGNGQFLAALATEERSVLGIEPSPANAAAARANGIPVDQTLLTETTRLTCGPFESFFAFHVLEHVPDVKAFLRAIRNNLTSDAVGCIEVPSTEAAYENERYGHFMTDHLSYFFLGTLRNAIESSGFEVIELERDWGGEHLVAYVRARRASTHAVVPTWVKSTSGKLAAFVSQAAIDGRSVAFWGASNPILPVLMHLPPELEYIVVDKALTKHGRFAPGSHIAICHPDELRARRIDYVIVTAPRFFNEISTELRATFDASVETILADVGVAQRVCRLAWRA